MSTATVANGGALDVSRTSKVPMSRLITVELRKMVDTRAGLWVLITIGVVTLLGVAIFGLAASDGEKTFNNFMGFTGGIQGLLLPVLGILLVTQEWGQRTAMVTFTLEPHRGKVIAAKIYASLLIGFAAFLVAVGGAALAAVVFGGGSGFDDLIAVDFLKFGLLQASGVLQGLAYGLLFLNSAVAIVTYLVLPLVFSIISSVVPAMQDAAPWVDLGTAQTPLFNLGALSGEEWAHVLVTALIWIVVPFVVGLWRVLRAELK